MFQIKFISQHYNNLLIKQFGINKTRKLINQKYYWPSLKKDVQAYIKGCNNCLLFKIIKHKLYSDLQTLLVSTH